MVLLVAIFAALALMLSMTPAHAVTQGGGAVDGTVTITSPGGIPTATQPAGPTTYSFGAIAIVGAFRNGSGNFAGRIVIPAGVTGGSPSENTLGGAGSVGLFAFSGPLGPGVGSISGSCSGSFNRNLSNVTVTLSCSASINGGPAEAGTVIVNAQFLPTAGNGITTPVTAAQFAGVYRAL